MHQLTIRTGRRNIFVEITSEVNRLVREAKLEPGQPPIRAAVVYCPHTTAAITINENADPDVVHDMLLYLDRTIPQMQNGFRHAEGNSDSHIKASFFGSSVTVLVDDGELVLGRWQGIYFCEFDGPRTREFMVQFLRG